MKPTLDFNAIRGVTRTLEPAEANLGDAIAANADLIAGVMRAQRTMRISPLLAHPIVAQLSGANADLVNGLGRTVEAHRLLASLRDDLGLRTVSFGGGMYKGDMEAAVEQALSPGDRTRPDASAA